MNEVDLLAAVAPVAEHFKAQGELSENTVLAAWLRSVGLQPRGEPWIRAKAALAAGASFEEAARRGVATPGDSSANTNEPVRDRHVLTAAPDIAQYPVPTTFEPASDNSEGPLTWFPKPFGPGDLDGEGARRLLGAPNIPVVSVLVRETAQNSWDARATGADVDFTINLRELDHDTVTFLRSAIFAGPSTGLGLIELLNRPTVWALEISDRGTSGLDGPTRNDLVVPEGVPTNYIDLVLNVGAPRDSDLGGGTYGFGKTIAYTASSCGTVLIWSRSREPTGYEDRLIGSAIGPGFNHGGHRYTGRHWWGRTVDRRIEPVVGNEATTIGKSLFSKHFDPEQTGTSILILDPVLGGESPEDTTARLLEAVRWHLWPKLIERRAADSAMNIAVLHNDQAVDMGAVDRHPILRGFVACLRAVRAAQVDADPPEAFPPVTVQTIWSERPRKLLGHLGLTRFPVDHGAETEFLDEVTSIRSPAHHIAWMRHSAELVVKYDRRSMLDTDGVQWAGVFKPVAEVDDSFAAAEPPAHDDWTPNAVSDRSSASEVRVALRRVQTSAAEFVNPFDIADRATAQSVSVAGLADSLADLIPSVEGARPTTEPSTRSPKPGNRRTGPRVVRYRLGPVLSSGRRLTAFLVRFEDFDELTPVRASCAIGVDGGADSPVDEAFIAGWSKEEPLLTAMPDVPQADAHTFETAEAWLLINSLANIAVDVSVDLGES